MGASLSFSVQKVHCSLKMYRLLLLNGLILMWVVLSAALPTNPYSSQLRSKVPRLGRRMGRSQGIAAEYMDSDGFPREGSLSHFFLKSSKAIPRLGRRKDLPALEKTMLENYLRRRLNLPDVGEEMDDGSLDNQLQAISNLLSDESPDEAKMSSELANELLRKWWPARLEDPIDD